MLTDFQSPLTIAVVSGEDTDAGKSTVARHVLRPAFKARYNGNCQYLLIEQPDPLRQRIGEGEDKRFGPEDTPEVLTMCAKNRARKKPTVIEVGGGQAAVFAAKVEEFKGSEGRIDLWLLPIRGTQKVDKIIETILKFISLGVDPSKLVLVVNFVPAGRTAADVIAKDLPQLADHSARYGYRILKAGIPSSETIRKMRELTTFTVPALAATDASDLQARAEALWAEDSEEAEKLGDELNNAAMLTMGAQGIIGHIEAVVAELLGDVPVAAELAA